MFSYECILAAVLLTSPKELPLDAQGKVWASAMRPTMVAMALDMEILDPRENGFYFGPSHDCANDLLTLQGRYQELKEMPSLADAERFPERKLINELLTHNRAYRNELQRRLTVDLVHAEELRTALSETDQLYHVWDTVRDARCEYYYVTVRRQALNLLRELIGTEAFYTGKLPPYLPAWHFPQAN